LVYQNNSTNHYIQLQLQFEPPNIHAIGSKVLVFYDGWVKPVKAIHPYKGFQSTVETKITIGLRYVDYSPNLKITWPNNDVQTIKQIPVDHSKSTKKTIIKIFTMNATYPNY